MRIEFELTYGDSKAAYYAYRHRKRSYVILDFIFFKLVPLATVIILLLIFIQVRRGRLNPWTYNLAPLLIAMTAASFVDRIFKLRHQRRNSFPVCVTDRKMIVEVNEENIVTTIPGAIRTEYCWASISLFLSSPQVSLLYFSPERFVLIPNRVLTAEQKAWLNTLVAQKGIKAKSC